MCLHLSDSEVCVHACCVLELQGTYITDDYDIHGYAFPWPFLPCPLCGQSFMHTIMYLHLSECVHVVFSCHGERHDYDIQGYVFPS